MTDHTTYVGTDGQQELLLTVFIDGTHTLATRPHPGATWSPPTELVRQSGEVSS